MNTRKDTEKNGDQPKALPVTTRIALAIWLAAIAGGTLAIAAYSNASGPVNRTVAQWPTDSMLIPSEYSPTVMLFLHPRCNCSWATLQEFERVLAGIDDSIKIRIGLFCPPTESDSWTETKLSNHAEQLVPGSTFVDRDATEAKQFGVSTSGHVLAFAPSGKCLFSGGITASRGHIGTNRGGLALVKILRGDDHPFFEQPVFGCSIIGSPTP